MTGPTDDEALFTEHQRALLALTLETEVRPDGLYLRLGPLQRTPRHVPAGEVASVAVEPYAAADHGGWHWGVRTSATGDRTAYRVRGREGVTVGRSDGSELFVGSGRPGELADALRAVAPA